MRKKETFFQKLHRRVEGIIKDFNHGLIDEDEVMEKADPKGDLEGQAFWMFLTNHTNPN